MEAPKSEKKKGSKMKVDVGKTEVQSEAPKTEKKKGSKMKVDVSKVEVQSEHTPVVEVMKELDVEKVDDVHTDMTLESSMESSEDKKTSFLDDLKLGFELLEKYKMDALNHYKELKLIFKHGEKEFSRLSKKGKKKRGTRSGFDKPLNISHELSVFMGVEPGLQQSRNEVIKYVHNYIKEHELKNPTNKKQIIPDAKLETLLQAKDTVVEYFGNLQTFLKPHFLKSDLVAVV